MASAKVSPLFVTLPHSGEEVPGEVPWLQGLPEETLMRDVDRFVDRLYEPAIQELQLPAIITPWHRYVVDLNRQPNEFDENAVLGAPFPAGTHPKGLHWCVTTIGETLIPQPMTIELHNKLLSAYYKPFHDSVQEMRRNLKMRFHNVYHLDLHSMPSEGTALHPDPGEKRAEVVISDQHGRSASSEFKDLVMAAFQNVGFQVAYNWPYVGGGITKTYGEPEKGFHTVQIELNRAQYMNEATKRLEGDPSGLQAKLRQALADVKIGLEGGLNG